MTLCRILHVAKGLDKYKSMHGYRQVHRCKCDCVYFVISSKRTFFYDGENVQQRIEYLIEKKKPPQFIYIYICVCVFVCACARMYFIISALKFICKHLIAAIDLKKNANIFIYFSISFAQSFQGDLQRDAV